MRIAGIIVTCNRKQMLNDLLEDFMDQSLKPDTILVIDNGSKDGTEELVREKYSSVEFMRLDENVGLWRGVEAGIKSIQEDYDAFWLVDDDARLSKDAFECLRHCIDTHKGIRDGIIWSTNLSPDGKYFTEPVGVKVDGEWKIYEEYDQEIRDKVYETVGGPNIGLYIPRSLIEQVGLPRSDMVMSGEYEFIVRVEKAGFKMYRCFSSVLYHKKHTFIKTKVMGRTRYISKVSPWQTYYEFRNRIYTDLSYKRRSVPRSLLNTAVDSIMKIYTCDEKIATSYYILRAVFDGLMGKLGMTVQIPRLVHDKKSKF